MVSNFEQRRCYFNYLMRWKYVAQCSNNLFISEWISRYDASHKSRVQWLRNNDFRCCVFFASSFFCGIFVYAIFPLFVQFCLHSVPPFKIRKYPPLRFWGCNIESMSSIKLDLKGWKNIGKLNTKKLNTKRRNNLKNKQL